MSIHHAAAGERVQLLLGDQLAEARTSAVVKTDRLEVIRLIVEAGKTIPEHHVDGPITVQCLEGRAAFTSGGVRHELRPGDFVHLASGQSHSVEGLEHASLLVTILLNGK